MHGLRELLSHDARHEPTRFDLEDLDDIARFVGHVKMPAMNNDPAHGVAGSAVHVEHHPKSLRRGHVARRAVAAFGKLALARRDQRAGKKIAVGKARPQMRRNGRGLASLRQDSEDGVGVLACDVEAAIVADLHVERVDHRRDMLGRDHHAGEVEHVGVAVVAGDVAVLAPRVGDVQIVTDQREAAGDVQRAGIGRRIEQQRMLLAWRPVVLEDADVLDALPCPRPDS